MRTTETISRYIRRTKFTANMNRYTIAAHTLFDLAQIPDRSRAIQYAFEYGVAKGYRAATAEAEKRTWEN